MAMTTNPGSRQVDVVLRDGSTVHVCPAKPADAPAALLCQLAEVANELGIQVLDAEVLPENRQMLRVFHDCGYPVEVLSLPGVELVELRTSLAQRP
jgi:hypothetical protein